MGALDILDTTSPFPCRRSDGPRRCTYSIAQTSARGVPMPRMDWEAFQEAHFRPHLLVVRVVDLEPQMAQVILGRWLDRPLNIPGNYAVSREGQGVLVAFENELDAKKLAVVLRAAAVPSEPMWASSWQANLDRAAHRRLRADAARRRQKRGSRST
jgi:hypothetical protein